MFVLTLLVAQNLALDFAPKTLWQNVPVNELMQDVEVCFAQEPDFGLDTVINKDLEHFPDGCKHEWDVHQKHSCHQLLQHMRAPELAGKHLLTQYMQVQTTQGSDLLGNGPEILWTLP